MDSRMPMRIWRVWPIQWKMTQPRFGVSLAEQGFENGELYHEYIIQSLLFKSLLGPATILQVLAPTYSAEHHSIYHTIYSQLAIHTMEEKVTCPAHVEDKENVMFIPKVTIDTYNHIPERLRSQIACSMGIEVENSQFARYIWHRIYITVRSNQFDPSPKLLDRGFSR
jgi:hypothetical protein